MPTIRGEGPAKATKITTGQEVGLLAMSTPRATVVQCTDDDDDDAWIKGKVSLLLSCTTGVGSRRERYHVPLRLLDGLGGTLEGFHIGAYSTVITHCVYYFLGCRIIVFIQAGKNCPLYQIPPVR